MKPIKLHDHVDSEHKLRLRRRNARLAASNMIVQLNIESGNKLSYLLGYPEAKSNLEAITCWINHIHKPTYITLEDYEYLVNRLEQSLMDTPAYLL